MGRKDLPLDSGARIAKVFERGFNLKYEGRSEKNHYIYTDPKNPHVFVSIPDHPEVDRTPPKTEIRKIGKKDNDFIKAYDQVYSGRSKLIPVRQDPETCCICHEEITSHQDTVKHKENGLSVHRECHDRIFGLGA